MKIEVSVRTNLVGSKVTDLIELPDDSTEEQIETAAREAMFNMIEWHWNKVDPTLDKLLSDTAKDLRTYPKSSAHTMPLHWQEPTPR